MRRPGLAANAVLDPGPGARAVYPNDREGCLIAGFPYSPNAATVHPVTETALRIIVELLKHKGIDAEFTESGVRLGIDDVRAHVETLKREESIHPAAPGEPVQTVSLRISVQLDSGDSRYFDDVVNGIGETLKDALAMAVSICVEGDLPTILPLLGGPVSKDVQVIANGHEWHTAPWTYFLGSYQLGGDHTNELAAHLSVHPPFLALCDILQTELAENAIHWLTVSGFRDGPGRAFEKLECQLDGKHFAAGDEALLSLDWPELQTPRFIRQFVVIVPDQAVEVAAGVAERK